MATPISGAQNLTRLSQPMLLELSDQSSSADDMGFQSLLLESLRQTGALELSAQDAIAESLAGGDIAQIEVFSAVKKADLALRMMLQIRNKLVEAYNEVKNMQM